MGSTSLSGPFLWKKYLPSTLFDTVSRNVVDDVTFNKQNDENLTCCHMFESSPVDVALLAILSSQKSEMGLFTFCFLSSLETS